MPERASEPKPFDAVLVRIEELFDRLNRIEEVLEMLASQRVRKEWYSTDEVAKILGKAPFTVREWCRLARINAEKRDTGRGNALEWMISDEELQRIRNHGLLPVPTFRHVR